MATAFRGRRATSYWQSTRTAVMTWSATPTSRHRASAQNALSAPGRPLLDQLHSTGSRRSDHARPGRRGEMRTGVEPPRTGRASRFAFRPSGGKDLAHANACSVRSGCQAMRQRVSPILSARPDVTDPAPYGDTQLRRQRMDLGTLRLPGHARDSRPRRGAPRASKSWTRDLSAARVLQRVACRRERADRD